jgi:hypothetical protein
MSDIRAVGAMAQLVTALVTKVVGVTVIADSDEAIVTQTV